jgi:hypothetical protein
VLPIKFCQAALVFGKGPCFTTCDYPLSGAEHVRIIAYILKQYSRLFHDLWLTSSDNFARSSHFRSQSVLLIIHISGPEDMSQCHLFRGFLMDGVSLLQPPKIFRETVMKVGRNGIPSSPPVSPILAGQSPDRCNFALSASINLNLCHFFLFRLSPHFGDCVQLAPSNGGRAQSVHSLGGCS